MLGNFKDIVSFTSIDGTVCTFTKSIIEDFNKHYFLLITWDYGSFLLDKSKVSIKVNQENFPN